MKTSFYGNFSCTELAIQPSLNASLMPRYIQNDASSGASSSAAGSTSATSVATASASGAAPLSPTSSGKFYFENFEFDIKFANLVEFNSF